MAGAPRTASVPRFTSVPSDDGTVIVKVHSLPALSRTTAGCVPADRVLEVEPA